jgi:hypothetical protein
MLVRAASMPAVRPAAAAAPAASPRGPAPGRAQPARQLRALMGAGPRGRAPLDSVLEMLAAAEEGEAGPGDVGLSEAAAVAAAAAAAGGGGGLKAAAAAAAISAVAGTPAGVGGAGAG